jgi:hypothetical protein
MPPADETVTLAGSGLTFVNTYGPEVTDAYRNEIITAENFLQSHFSNPVTLNVTFDLQAINPDFVAQNTASSLVHVSYAVFAAALSAHATTADDQIAVAGLPVADPTRGVGFQLPAPYAVALGLSAGAASLNVVMAPDVAPIPKEAVSAIEHEITESGFGREASLGLFSPGIWWPEDLFRFTAGGQRDLTGGADGIATFFGLDSAHVGALAFHNSLSPAGVNDGFDFGDWDDNVLGDAFGSESATVPGAISATDLQVLDILGWTPIAQAAPAAGPDDFANSFTDVSHPIGQAIIGGAVQGAVNVAGDRDWFVVQLHKGDIYDVTESGGAGADIFHGSQDAGIDRVLDFNLAEGDRVMLDPGTTFTVSQVGNDTVIDMGAINGQPNQMILVGVPMSTLTGNWIFEG